MKKASSTSWHMSDEQRELFPAISGHEINGLGESKSRRKFLTTLTAGTSPGPDINLVIGDNK